MKLSDNRESNLSLEPELNQSFSLQDSYKKKTNGKRKLKGPDVGTAEWGNESEDFRSDSENSEGSDCYSSESEEEEKEINEGIYHYHHFWALAKNFFYPSSSTLLYFVKLWQFYFLQSVVFTYNPNMHFPNTVLNLCTCYISHYFSPSLSVIHLFSPLIYLSVYLSISVTVLTSSNSYSRSAFR